MSGAVHQAPLDGVVSSRLDVLRRVGGEGGEAEVEGDASFL